MRSRVSGERELSGGIETVSRQVMPKHQGRPAVIRDQGTKPANEIDNLTKSAKPPPPFGSDSPFRMRDRRLERISCVHVSFNLAPTPCRTGHHQAAKPMMKTTRYATCINLLTGGLLVRIQPEEPIYSRSILVG